MKTHTNKRDQKKYRLYLLIKISVFFLTLFVFAFIGILLPLRPKTSELEKRELTKFPDFSVSGFLSGQFFADIDTWYADTYPLREPLLAANAALDDLHGLHTDTFVAGSSGQKGEEIPTGDAANAGTDVQADLTEGGDTDKEEADDAEMNGQTEMPDEEAPITEGDPEVFGDVYITQGRAFELFYFVTDYSNRFCKALNTFQAKVGDGVTVYAMPVPVNSGIILDDEMQEKLGTSDQKAATEYLFANLDERIKPVAVYGNLRKHRAEYVYFRTDHHWTQLGAYYAYEVFADVKGITANSLDSFQTLESDGFLGSFYSDSQSEELKESADTVTAYVPNGTNEISGVTRTGEQFTGEIVADGADYGKSSLYLTYIKGDNPYSEIHNPAATDGTSLLVIKESYANCFVPFLVDHYQDIYIVDYRYYQDNIYELVQEKGVSDVLFLNNLSAINDGSRMAEMEGLIE